MNNNYNEKQYIIELVQNNYNISVSDIIPITKGVNNLFTIVSNEKKYVLKQFQEKFSVSDIIREYEIINSLAGIDTYEYMLTKENKCYFDNGNNVYILLKYITGIEYDNNSLDIKKLKQVAILHAKITKELNKEHLMKDFNVFLSQAKINKNADYMKNYINEHLYDNYNLIVDDYKTKLNIIEKLDITNLFYELNNRIKCIRCHGDFSTQQLIFSDNKLFVLDFSADKFLPVGWEIIRSYSYCDKDCADGKINIQNLIAYIKWFNDIYNLSYDEIILMPVMYMLQILASDFGYKQYNSDNSETDLLEFGKFRTNICYDIYNNLEYYISVLKQNFNK